MLFGGGQLMKMKNTGWVEPSVHLTDLKSKVELFIQNFAGRLFFCTQTRSPSSDINLGNIPSGSFLLQAWDSFNKGKSLWLQGVRVKCNLNTNHRSCQHSQIKSSKCNNVKNEMSFFPLHCWQQNQKVYLKSDESFSSYFTTLCISLQLNRHQTLLVSHEKMWRDVARTRMRPRPGSCTAEWNDSASWLE